MTRYRSKCNGQGHDLKVLYLFFDKETTLFTEASSDQTMNYYLPVRVALPGWLASGRRFPCSAGPPLARPCIY